MTAGWVPLTGAAVMTATLSLSAPPPSQRTPQFGATAAGVAVRVQVRDGNSPVRGLAATDFVLVDSGVRQDVLSVDGSKVPLDLSLVVQNVLRTGGERRETLQPEVVKVAKLLTSEDRLRVIMVGNDVYEVVPLSRAPQIPEMPAGQDACAPIIDAVTSVLVRPTDAGRQQVVLVLGGGAGDATSFDVMADLARRSDVVLHLASVSRGSGTINIGWIWWPRCVSSTLDWDQARRRELRQIGELTDINQRVAAFGLYWRRQWREIAELTGGSEIQGSAIGNSITGAARRALDDARSGYVLYYQPKGVPEKGWHPITVRTNRPGKLDVHARRGYLR